VLYQTVKSASTMLGIPVPKSWERVKRIQDAWSEEK